MSSITPNELFTPLLNAATELAWRQWATIGSSAHASANGGAIVDPEALLLLTTELAKRDPRLDELLHHWVVAHSKLLSTQRAKNLVAEFPVRTKEGLAGIAQLALTRGSDSRWKTLAQGEAPQPNGGLTLRSAPVLRLGSPSALMLRLRLGFGVGIKADALAYLLGVNAWATVSEVARAVNYNPVAVRRSLDDLAAGRFIETNEPEERRGTRSRQYCARQAEWRVAGVGDESLVWGYFAERFEFVAKVANWLEGPNGAQQWSPLQVGDWGRTWVEAHHAAFRYPDGHDDANFRGTLEEWGEHFPQAVKRLGEWLGRVG